MDHFLVGVFSRQISLCGNFYSKVGVGVISVEYGTTFTVDSRYSGSLKYGHLDIRGGETCVISHMAMECVAYNV